MGRARLQLFIFFLCFAMCLSKPVQAQFRFSQIVVKGNSTTDVETIKSISGLKQNIPLSAADLNSALKNLYNSNLFENVEVTPKGQTIVIKVKENKRIRRLVFEGNKKTLPQKKSAVQNFLLGQHTLNLF